MWQDLREYYRTVAPFYAAEMAGKDDLPQWHDLVRRLGSRRVLDLGCGGGRLGKSLVRGDPDLTVTGIDALDVLAPGPLPFVQGDMRSLPFRPSFDLVAAANDPFAHLLTDADRTRALSEARRVLAPGGRAVVDGVYRRASGSFERVHRLGDVTLTEEWRDAGAGIYDTRYVYRRDGAVAAVARARVRAWDPRESALLAAGAQVHGGLDGRAFDPDGERLVVVIGGGL